RVLFRSWPVTNSISPAWTSKLTSLRAACPPGYCLLTLSKRRTAMPGFYRGAAVRLVPGTRSTADQRLQSATDPRQQRRLGRRRRLDIAPRLGGRGRMAAVAAWRIALRGLGGLRGAALAAFHAFAAAAPATLARRVLAFGGRSRPGRGSGGSGSGGSRDRRRLLLSGAGGTGLARAAAAGIAASTAPTATT